MRPDADFFPSPVAAASPASLIDTTLREGEQRCGVYFDMASKKRIVELAATIGTGELELGVTGRCRDLAPLVEYARTRVRAGTALSVWCAAGENALRAAAAMRPDRVCCSVPVSDAHIVRKLGSTRAAVLDRVKSLCDLARDLGIGYLSLGLEDASRADLDFALDVARVAEEHGAARLRLSDTVGVLSPARTAALIASFKNVTSLSLALHCHNDFGLAAGNALAGLELGAEFADVSALGLGERAGIAPLEQVAGYLLAMGTQTAGPDSLRAVTDYAREAARLAGTRPEPFAPLLGERLFWCETGLHVDGLYKATDLYEPLAPERLGLTRNILIGKKIGRSALRRKLRCLGLEMAPQEVEPLVERVRGVSGRLGRALEDDELLEIVRAG